MANNGDTTRKFKVGEEEIVGVGSFHKTLPHNQYGEVDCAAFDTFVKATEGTAEFAAVPKGSVQQNPPIPNEKPAAFVNPQAGLAHDRLTRHPVGFDMPPAPAVLSVTSAAEITELYWMSLLRDISFDEFAMDPSVAQAAAEINDKFQMAVQDIGDAGHLKTGIDVPGASGTLNPITSQNVFRIGLPGEEIGPLVSQFFIRNANFGTQTINQKQRPYRKGRNYLTSFNSWLHAQNSGNGDDGLAYSRANEAREDYYEDQDKVRYISTMRDLARFVNKDALHQAYFNAALLLLSGGARWTPGNPYGDGGRLEDREAGFGTLGGPHILALVSEVATRALKIVWNQKWQVHLRLRPEAYGGLVHVQNIGVGADCVTRCYGLPEWVSQTEAAEAVKAMNKHCGEASLLLPMAFTPGGPAHPAYGAGHATVAGICVTVLKAYFKTFDVHQDGSVVPLPIASLMERSDPYANPEPFKAYITGVDECGFGFRKRIDAGNMTIEGELNKLAMNVAMGRSMGGVHWRTDNTRSLVLGEAIAAQILADITVDLVEHPKFEFRTFSRKTDGQPKIVEIQQGRIKVDGVLVDSNSSAL
ncbi:MAG: vanadium-dependent haloperoxidase [Pegethrix bostrychoides GSE-TBD4-15B]|jgi:hypothetical protein|uniref:Vanadium-dependent haloperoxidase n=1 Tax=Pegethrix bostrychoides GSE-TBD4-15B TaxID=2839662 RepID=A0A951U676_9CYAN|nr:vanadium-dependent haloperoxidase [Pegethrix bostrychoides GSE-TBD4-15B]